jgi:hypothetical protein
VAAAEAEEVVEEVVVEVVVEVAAQLLLAHLAGFPLVQVLVTVSHLQCQYRLVKLVQSSKEMIEMVVLPIQKILRKKIVKLQKL